MPSQKTITAVRVARALRPAEVAVNEAAIGVLAVGTEVLRARVGGGFGALEGQEAVNKIGQVTTMLFGAMSEMAVAHAALRGLAADHEILSYGDLCPPPLAYNEPVEQAENVSPIRSAA